MPNTLSTDSGRRDNPNNNDAAALKNIAIITSNTFRTYHQKLTRQIEQIEVDLDCIMNRKRRDLVANVLTNLKKIKDNIEVDPVDIHEESTLPEVVKELVEALREYVSIIPHRIPASHYQAQSEAIERIFSEAAPWLDQILERMLTNDKQGLIIRSKALSSVFERGARLHQVQKEIRAGLKESEK